MDKFSKCLARLDVMIVSTKHALATVKDDPNNHLRPCECKRGVTRNGVCSECVSDSKRKELGL